MHDIRGQACDGASNMLGESGVAKCIEEVIPKALPVNFLGHCLDLAVKSVNAVSKGMKDYMEAYLEIINLTKHSPKQEASFEGLKWEKM